MPFIQYQVGAQAPATKINPRKRGKEKAEDAKDLVQMLLNNLTFGIIKFLPSVGNCLNAKLIIPFEKKQIYIIHISL